MGQLQITKPRAAATLWATLAVAAAISLSAGEATASALTPPTGGTPGSEPTPKPAPTPKPVRPTGPVRAGQIAKPTWLTNVKITEYFPAPEAWFKGRKIAVPGLNTRHRVDWLYSARGVSMQGEGKGLDGRMYHINGMGVGGWVNNFGTPWCVCAGVYWRAGGYWLNAKGQFTWPYDLGGWYRGVGVRFKPLAEVNFQDGPARALVPNESVAVDTDLIALGSRIYIPAYKKLTGGSGWYYADDTGGAIIGRHLDIYRVAPTSSDDPGRTTDDARIYVIPPKLR